MADKKSKGGKGSKEAKGKSKSKKSTKKTTTISWPKSSEDFGHPGAYVKTIHLVFSFSLHILVGLFGYGIKRYVCCSVARVAAVVFNVPHPLRRTYVLA